MRGKGARATAYVADVTKESQVIQTFDAVVADLRRFDVLVNNAGITRDALLVKAQDGAIHSKMTLAQWQAVMDVNLTGASSSAGREGAERMIQLGHGGVIVNISSISREGNPGQTNYFGRQGRGRRHDRGLGRGNSPATASARGGDRAGILLDAKIPAAMKPEMLARVKAAVPLHRLGEPAEIASTAVSHRGKTTLSRAV